LAITSTGTSNYTAEVFNASALALGYGMPQVFTHVSSIRYWNITQSSATGFTSATVSITYGADDDVTDPPNLRLAKSNGGTWENLGGSGSGFPAGTITSGSFTSFSIFTLANQRGYGENPLPVELVKFEAKIDGDKVNLAWETASEKDNDFFTVERSKDGVNFETVDHISGKGTTTATQYYKISDYYPLSGISYYRLKQTDYDGSFEYSKLVMVSYEGGFDFLVYPTIASSYINFKISGNKNDELLLTIYDLKGTQHLQKVISLTNENDIIRIDKLETMPNGMYILNVSNSKMTNTQKFVVSR
jgi:hypothetical protein